MAKADAAAANNFQPAVERRAGENEFKDTRKGTPGHHRHHQTNDKGVLFGANYTTPRPLLEVSLQEREAVVRQRIKYYKHTAAVEGGISGAGGILLGIADFPVLIGIKLKLLFDIASMYGYDVKDYKERVYILHIFELAFPSHEHRRNVYLKMVDWNEKSNNLHDDIHQFDWRNFQQEYRDYIDLAKMAQLVPFIGAPVGFVVQSL